MKIELKPNWDNAPEWARYWTVDKDGKAWWHREKPNLDYSQNGWYGGGNAQECKSVCTSWKESLQERPLILTNVARPSTLGDLRDFMTTGIESKLDRIIDMLSQKLMVDVGAISKDMKK